MSNSTLFTLTESWYQSPWIYEQMAFASDRDTILLMQDAVLALQSPITLASFVAKCNAIDVKVCALQNDCHLRGIDNQYPNIELIDYEGFVELVIQHSTQVAW